MNASPPLVSVSMIAYNVEAFVSQAIEGVLKQETNFPVELVIGEDCSQDATRSICESYARRFPGKVRLLPSVKNHGLSPNAFRTLQSCRGKYIAICDSDDYWDDPLKLQKQVDFLEENPDYGLVYSDVELIGVKGEFVPDDSHAIIRSRYQGGEIFFELLGGNFINNSTSLFRRQLLTIPDGWRRNWYAYDAWLWLNVAMRSKVHFLAERTTFYRKHEGAVTLSRNYHNEERDYFVLFHVVMNFHKYFSGKLSSAGRIHIFRLLLRLLYRRTGSLKMKMAVLKLFPAYYPGWRQTLNILVNRVRRSSSKARLDYSTSNQ